MSLDSLLKEIATETQPMTDEYARGVDTLDVKLIESASRRVQHINALIEQASQELAKLQE